MYRNVDDFLAAYGFLAEGTAKILSQLTDDNLKKRVGKGHRSLGEIAWHLVSSVPEMMNRTGLEVSSVRVDAPPPKTAEEILDAYRTVSSELDEAIRENWSDATLLDEDDMYGQTWARGFTLQALVHHEIHHRGQMTVLLRQAGTTVPGTFGPSKEEWTGFGMEAPPY